MLRLRKILLHNAFFYIIFVITLYITGIRLIIPKYSSYQETDTTFTGIVTRMISKEDQVTIYLKNKETVIAWYKTSNPLDFSLGDTIKVEGTFHKPQENKTQYLFNDQKYCYRKNIFYRIEVNSYEKIKENKNIYYYIKKKIVHRLGTNPYLNTFILGDKSFLSTEVKRSYQANGISHLFAISGMHISLLSTILEKILKKKFSQETVFKITSLFLWNYLFLVGFSPSILRGVLFYFLFSINRLYYFYVNPKNLFLFTLSFSLLINPNIIFDTGFLYSYSISFGLITHQNYIKAKNYFTSLLKVSCFAFLISLPITLYSFQQINLLSILYNLFFVPFISLFLFPFTLLVFFLKPLEPIYLVLIKIMERISLLISPISFGKILFKRLPFFIYIIYFTILLIYLLTNKKKVLILFFLLLSIHLFIPWMNQTNYFKIIDVGQGDSTLLHLNHKNILIDTGGLYNEGSVFYNTLDPIFRSEGIQKLQALILTHGDKDHMGEAITLVKNMKVEKVILNCGEQNSLEKELIKVLEQKHIKYFSCMNDLEIAGNKLYFLQTKDYADENENSNVIYIEINHYKFLFMGDAGIPKEKDLLKEYDLPQIDGLKVGHHGSKTCSSEKFIYQINPQYSFISVGKDNKFKHPHTEVLKTLKNSKIYRTDENGTIIVILKKNQLKIEAYTS